MNFKILHQYRFDDYTTLVLEHCDNIEGLQCFGTFEMNLMDAEAMGLHPILDSEFIKKTMQKDMFFSEIRNDYFDLILKGINADSAEGMYLTKVEKEEL